VPQLVKLMRLWDRCDRNPKVEEKLQKELIEGLKKGQFWWKGKQEISISLPGIHYWLGKLGEALKLPCKTHIGKLEAFPRGGKKVRVWIADELRNGVLS